MITFCTMNINETSMTAQSSNGNKTLRPYSDYYVALDGEDR